MKEDIKKELESVESDKKKNFIDFVKFMNDYYIDRELDEDMLWEHYSKQNK